MTGARTSSSSAVHALRRRCSWLGSASRSPASTAATRRRKAAVASRTCRSSSTAPSSSRRGSRSRLPAPHAPGQAGTGTRGRGGSMRATRPRGSAAGTDALGLPARPVTSFGAAGTGSPPPCGRTDPPLPTSALRCSRRAPARSRRSCWAASAAWPGCRSWPSRARCVTWPAWDCRRASSARAEVSYDPVRKCRPKAWWWR